jgi:hypothetical protein
LATDALEPVNVDSGKTPYDHVTQLTHETTSLETIPEKRVA